MKKFLRSDAGALVAYFLAVVLLGALLMPWMFRAGMWLNDLAEAGKVGGLLESVGQSAASAAEKGKISRFFARALMLAALVLMPALLWRLRATGARTAGLGMAKAPLPRGFGHGLLGFSLAAGILWLVAMGLTRLGAFVPDGPVRIGELLNDALVPALGTAIVGEWLFRGFILGVWLRAQSTGAAILGSSLLFACVHPLPGVKVADPGAALAGFEFLGQVISRYADPQVFIAELLTLFALGVVLAWARVRTQALWLPIGLHAGIVFAFKGFNLGHQRAQETLPHWLVGDDLRAGIVPLLSLAVMAAILAMVVKPQGQR